MSGAINTGGPAFPHADQQAVHAIAAAAIESITGTAERDRIYTLARGRAAQGMTLRDYFAANEPIDPTESIGLALAERLAGRPAPKATASAEPGILRSVDPYEMAVFWADAEAAYRYLRADAMLRAREGGAA